MRSVLQENREAVLARLAAACRDAGRSHDAARLVAVTKSVSAEVAGELFALGQRDLAEARVDVLERKVEALAGRGPSPTWHLIGHLQRNKARRAVLVADVIHSVDTPALLATLDRVAREEGRRPAIFLQVKLTDEEDKHGLEADTLPAVTDAARAAERLALRGLMTMAPLVDGGPAARADAARATFERLASLADELPGEAFETGRPLLSMGMSGDFEVAARCGADLVRVGTALFDGVERSREGAA